MIETGAIYTLTVVVTMLWLTPYHNQQNHLNVYTSPTRIYESRAVCEQKKQQIHALEEQRAYSSGKHPNNLPTMKQISGECTRPIVERKPK